MFYELAEVVGFEPTDPVKSLSLSRRAPLTAQPHFHNTIIYQSLIKIKPPEESFYVVVRKSWSLDYTALGLDPFGWTSKLFHRTLPRHICNRHNVSHAITLVFGTLDRIRTCVSWTRKPRRIHSGHEGIKIGAVDWIRTNIHSAVVN